MTIITSLIIIISLTFITSFAILAFKLEIQSPGFSWKFGDQVAPLVLVLNLATRWRHFH